MLKIKFNVFLINCYFSYWYLVINSDFKIITNKKYHLTLIVDSKW